MDNVTTLFRENDNTTAPPDDSILKVLIVDDEPTVHEITALVLKGFRYRGYRLELVSAYSATEAKEILSEEGPFALILLDVIMETDDAGLNLARFIREELKDQMVRIILRTGEPGMVPQRQVMRDYEIDDYKEKAELTSERFDATVTASIRTYLGFKRLEESRKGLEKILDAIREVEIRETDESLANRILEQIEEVMNRTNRPGSGSILVAHEGEGERIITGRGSLGDLINSSLEALKDQRVAAQIRETMEAGSTLHDGNHIMTTLLSSKGGRYCAYFEDLTEYGDMDRYLVELYASHVNVSLDNKMLNQELIETQREIIATLGEVIESRSGETGKHVQRVGEISRLLATKLDFEPDRKELLLFATPLHDIGKVGIRDQILNKPGRLTPDEYELMKTHARIGYEILKASKRPVLKMGARICLEHHEWWNGGGYPNGLSGEDIAIEARICSIADVLDALRQKRHYRGGRSFTMDEALDIISQGRGTQFDPHLVDLVIDNRAEFETIYDQYGVD